MDVNTIPTRTVAIALTRVVTAVGWEPATEASTIISIASGGTSLNVRVNSPAASVVLPHPSQAISLMMSTVAPSITPDVSLTVTLMRAVDNADAMPVPNTFAVSSLDVLTVFDHATA